MLCAGPNVLGYLVAMKGVDEVHLLNLTVAPDFQRQGWARLMMEGLVLWSRGQGARQLWLEVRESNTRALEVYRRFGFGQMGVRKQYYPLAPNRREDAVVMSLKL
jgi:ribosomal-protein-alanine N-acetyltransferase